ncbi:nuclear pore complex protein Nup85-like protein, partial [Aphelenchoides avenae]
QLLQLVSGSPTPTSTLDETLLAILSLDYLKAIQLVCKSNNTWWFAAHLTDLLYKLEQNVFTGANIDLRSKILTEYAKSLFDRPQLWDIAPGYVLNSGVENVEEALDELLLTVEADSDRKVDRLVAMCRKYSLPKTYDKVTRKMTKKFVDEHSWSAALNWALLNESLDLITQVANKVLLSSTPEQISEMRMFDAVLSPNRMNGAILKVRPWAGHIVSQDQDCVRVCE